MGYLGILGDKRNEESRAGKGPAATPPGNFSTNSLQEIVTVCQEIFNVKSSSLDFNMDMEVMLLSFYRTLFS